jgi:hypothetical protein
MKSKTRNDSDKKKAAITSAVTETPTQKTHHHFGLLNRAASFSASKSIVPS